MYSRIQLRSFNTYMYSTHNLMKFQGTPILQVTAVDGDRGIPNEVSYSFLEGNHQFFNINALSGEITVSDLGLDREDQAILDLFGVIDFVVLVSGDSRPFASPRTLRQATSMLRHR